MAKKYLDYDGLLYLWQKIKNVFTVKSDSIKNITRSGTTFTATRADGSTFTFTQQDNNTTYSDATTSAAGLMSASDKTKLNGIASGAEVNQNAFSNVKVGSTTVAADGKTDTLELVAGSNVTLTPDATNDKVTIAATDTTYSAATTSAAGLMSASDKTKFNTISNGGTAGQVWATTGSNSTGWKTLTASDVSAIPTSAKGAASGVCPLNASSKIDSTYLPSFVDDVVEAYARSGQTALSQNWLATGSATGTVITPEAGKIYILMAESGDYSANTQFRWSGTTYVKLNDGGVSAITNAEIDTIVAT